MSASDPRASRRIFRRVVVAAVAAVSSVALYIPSAAGAGDAARAAGDIRTLGDPVAGLADLDARAGAVGPTATQRAIVSQLGAHVTWNRFGTPRSLVRYGGYLATGLSGDAVDAARSFVSANRALFRLSDASVANLELLNDSPIVGTKGHAVLFRQTFGGLPATQDGLITVGVNDAGVFYVSSSAAGNGSAPGAASLSATAAWLKAAANIGRGVGADAIADVRQENGWTIFKVSGFAQQQRSRLTAFPTFTEGVRPAYETIVLDVAGGKATAYKLFVDAQTGKVWFRENAVDNLSQGATVAAPSGGFFQGETGGPSQPCDIADGATFDAPSGTKSIDVVASADNPINDIVLNLIYNPTGDVVASTDTLFSPEAVHYTGDAGVVPPGSYSAQVCQFDPSQDGFPYSGFYSVNDTVAVSFPYPPKWKYFQANPPVNYSSADTRVVGCWEAEINGTPVPGCDLTLKNLAARGPWDYDFRTNMPTYSTRGNAADTAEAWTSPLTPGPTSFRPVSLTREYIYDWSNAWFTSKCSQSNFVPGTGNDIEASITNLFAGHNRFHDFSYFLGFTEQNSNLQEDNFGNTAPGPFPSGREGDPELGNVQAGAVTGGPPTFLGRDNANQITLNDGIPGITNQYLFQPIAGAFYAPCVDGDLDGSVFGHEYTHAISNRMVAGPDSGLSGYQAGSMGESWSDLNAVEYLHEYNLVPTGNESPWAVGPYVTGNPTVGIRDYAINRNPLNYSDLGFDITGPEVHADGEIWNGTNYDLRAALVAKYQAQFPATDAALQKRCADGELPADECPGNRRWIQIVYDAFLLQPANTTMLDARDAYLAADVNRFGGANQRELWRAFAARGMGEFASTTDTNDSQPAPSFESPREADEARITFDVTAADEDGQHVDATIYIGDYEARVSPVADTDPGTRLPDTVNLVPGHYDLMVQAPGYGLHGIRNRSFKANQRGTFQISIPSNWASGSQGATATGDGSDPATLLDDTERTNWTASDGSSDTSVIGKKVMVHLGGSGAHRLGHLHVSAMLKPGQNRFTALRQFELWACDSTAKKDCADPASFTRVYTSRLAAFPGNIPRPLAPDLIIRPFHISATATDIMLVVLDNQCTGGPRYQGDQDDDPTNNTDCTTGSVQGQTVRAAELQVFRRPPTMRFVEGGTG
jgi:extracellular elastinolytic metalloproteinase